MIREYSNPLAYTLTFLLLCIFLSCSDNDVISIPPQIEADIEGLVNRIQSVVVIPQDIDGSVLTDSEGNSTICFHMTPAAVADSITKVWNTMTEQDKSSLMDFDIRGTAGSNSQEPDCTIKSVSFTDGELLIEVHFADLPKRAVASLQLEYGESDIASGFFAVRPESESRHHVSPTGIAVLAVNPIYLTTGTQASVEFRVNPSNATFSLSGDNCQIELDKVGTVRTKSSYVTVPSNYRLDRVEYVFDSETGELKAGQYRAIIGDTGISAEYDEMAALVLNATDADGDDIQISSSAFEIIGQNFENLPRTGLPLVIINTPDSEPVDSREIWKDGSTVTVINSDMTYDFQGTLSIKGRGNSSWTLHPKKSYSLKLSHNSVVQGMPKHKRWCLLANWMDRTLIRNAVTFEIARSCPGLDWTPSGTFAEVILNGEHIGNYYLCEQIRVDRKRVNISDLDTTVTEGDGITGGYIMELDVNYDEANKFMSSIRNLPWMFKDPEDVNSVQFSYMQDYVNAMEDALYDDTKFAAREFTEYMDLESFVDWWLVNELSMNWEANHPKSSYMHKDINGLMKAGPVWDYDWGTYTPGGVSTFFANDAVYFGRLFEDEPFRALTKSKWISQKERLEDIIHFIDSLGVQLEMSDRINHAMWPITQTVNGDENMTFDEAISRMKETYQNRLIWLDTQILTW